MDLPIAFLPTSSLGTKGLILNAVLTTLLLYGISVSTGCLFVCLLVVVAFLGTHETGERILFIR